MLRRWCDPAGAQRRPDLVAIAAHDRDGEFERAALVGGDALDDEGRAALGKVEQLRVLRTDRSDAIDFRALAGTMP